MERSRLAEERVDEQVVPGLVLGHRPLLLERAVEPVVVGRRERLEGVGVVVPGGGRWCGGRGAADGDVVVVLALVGGDHGARVVGRALHVLADGAASSRALVVAPVRKNCKVRLGREIFFVRTYPSSDTKNM
jgi:hypothetical protein